MSVLVVGADGAIGRAILARTDGLGTTRRKERAGPGRPFLDLAGVFEVPSGVSVAYVCAAVTSTDACEKDPAGTARVNVEATTRLARTLAERGAFVVFPSTNLVFDGTVPHRRIDEAPCPTIEYGRQKMRAEAALLALGPSVAVVRITKVINADHPLVKGWIEEFRAGRTIRPFTDRVIAPVPLDFTIRALLAIGEARAGGIHHVSGDADVTWADLAARLAERLGVDGRLVEPKPATKVDPRHTTLDTSGLTARFGLVPPDLDAALDVFVPRAAGRA